MAEIYATMLTSAPLLSPVRGGILFARGSRIPDEVCVNKEASVRRISLVEMMLAVALAGTLTALVQVGVDHWDYRTVEKIHDELGDLVFGRGHFTPLPPANERQRLADEARARRAGSSRLPRTQP
jgi:hypothetical protein